MSVVRCSKRYALFLTALMAMSTASFAVSMDTVVGFDNTIKAGAWIPIAVTLTNDDAQDVEGVLVAKLMDPSVTVPLCTTRVNLPANSKKLYHIYTKMSGYGGAVRVTFSAPGWPSQVKTINTTSADMNDRLVISVGKRSSRLGFLSGEKVPAFPGVMRYNQPNSWTAGSSTTPSPEAQVFTSSISTEAMPDRPAGYETVDVMVLSDFSPHSVRPAVLRSIATWVASGGVLIISAGADYKMLQNSFYSDLLPVKLTGTASLPGMASLSALGKEPFPSGAVSIAKNIIKPRIGSAMLTQNGVPILAKRSYGAGRVIFVAFDSQSQPFRGWNGQTEFWKYLIKTQPEQTFVPTAAGCLSENGGYYGAPGTKAPMSDVVRQDSSVKMPGISTIGLFMLAYLVVLVPVNYMVLKRKRRLEMAWVTTPVIVVAFTLGAYAIGSTMKGGKLSFYEATIVEGSSNARYARMITDASLFSPAKRNYDVKVIDSTALCQVIPSRDDSEPSIAYLSNAPTIEQVPMSMWSTKEFESVGGMDLGGVVKSELVTDGYRIQGKITNNTAFPLSDCWVIFRGSSVSLGNLPAGASAVVDMARGASHGQPAGSQPNPPYIKPGTLSYGLKTHAQYLASQAKTPVLVGSMPGGNMFGTTGNNATVKSARMCLIRLDIGR